MSSKTWELVCQFEVGGKQDRGLEESELIHLVVRTPQPPGTSHGNTPQHGSMGAWESK